MVSAFAQELPTEDSMMIKAAALTKLTSAVEAVVHYPTEEMKELDDVGLLEFATTEDKSLLTRFIGLHLKVKRENGHAAVLVCNEQKTQALLEDVGCTAELDRHAWREAGTACTFSIDLSSLCTSRTIATTITPPPPSTFVTMQKQAMPLIEVKKAVWTRGVDRRTKQPTDELADNVFTDQLVLWVHILGSKDALTQLKAKGKLPIRHKWFRALMIGTFSSGVMTPTDEVDIPAGRTGVLEKLRQEVATRGHFNWRTWSAKAKVSSGEWRVRMDYADNTPVLCGNPSELRPCEYKILLR